MCPSSYPGVPELWSPFAVTGVSVLLSMAGELLKASVYLCHVFPAAVVLPAGETMADGRGSQTGLSPSLSQTSQWAVRNRGRQL